ncbi:Sugar phosphate isomerase/epimerase [Microbacterium saccharophilum]|uniref:Sugar phosphate isomerase/epimerase n=2 Tax=Microbacteriaceae TaxID=85023 RepID=A0A7Z7CYL8_9MICO|nr:Sugar phosphate isomerase/epimerase [Microbacterium saccharophilum]
MSINHATIRRTNLQEALDVTQRCGVASIGLWREQVAERGLRDATRRLSSSGLRLSSICRAGYVTSPETASWSAAIEDCQRAIEETADLAAAGAPGSRAVLVIVAGGLPPGSRDLAAARERTREAIACVESTAADAGVTLAIEALHPMYAADRGVISTLAEALDMAEQFGPHVGVMIDTFHTWWDPSILEQIARAGASARIAGFQVSDWMTPLPADVLLGRGVMGDGHIDFAPLTRAIVQTGYDGDVEVEIFNQPLWEMPSFNVVRRCVAAFRSSIPLPE